MDTAEYRLRPFADDDYPALSRLRTRTNGGLPSTPEEERRWDQVIATARLTNERWVVDERISDKTVAVGALNQTPFSFDPHKFWVDVMVDPHHTHRGIGRRLVQVLESEAADHRATCFWANVRKEDVRAARFAEAAGFVELRTTWMSELDVTQPVPTTIEDRTAEFENKGIRFTTFAAEGPTRAEVLQRLLDLWNEAGRDMPRMGEYTPVTPTILKASLEGPEIIPEAFFLACSGDSYVASTHLEREQARPDSLLVGFTATRGAFRGQGLATELKRRSVAFARDHNFRYLRTFNDSQNPAIWAINEKMGFRRSFEISQRERRFATPAAAVPADPSR